MSIKLQTGPSGFDPSLRLIKQKVRRGQSAQHELMQQAGDESERNEVSII